MSELKINEGINLLVGNKDISGALMTDIMGEIMDGETQDSQIGSFLTALRIRGETDEIVSAAASVMRKYATPIKMTNRPVLVDTCGTGGDNSDTFNISTLSAIITAGAGVAIAKHGNRSVSSQCGSADILEGFGAIIDLEPHDVQKMIDDIGFGFMFAPKFHPAMRFVMPTRRSLGMRTVFNILGPLTNPAGAQCHVLGVFDKKLTETMANVMNDLGSEHVFVVHSDPGVDEIVPINDVHISEVKDGKVNSYTMTGKDYGLDPFTLEDIKGGDLNKNLDIAVKILKDEDKGIKRKIAVLNAAYAILSSGIVDSFNDALLKAEESITSGSAQNKLGEYVKASGGNLATFNALFA